MAQYVTKQYYASYEVYRDALNAYEKKSDRNKIRESLETNTNYQQTDIKALCYFDGKKKSCQRTDTYKQIHIIKRLLPFKYPVKPDTLIFGTIDLNKCILSSHASASIIYAPFHLYISYYPSYVSVLCRA